MDRKISRSERINKAFNDVNLARSAGETLYQLNWRSGLTPILNGDWSGLEKQIANMMDAFYVRGHIPKPIHCILAQTRGGIVHRNGEVHPGANGETNHLEGYFVLGTEYHQAK